MRCNWISSRDLGWPCWRNHRRCDVVEKKGVRVIKGAELDVVVVVVVARKEDRRAAQDPADGAVLKDGTVSGNREPLRVRVRWRGRG